MSFRVELSARAYADLDRLMIWLEERSSPAAADRLSERFYKALDRLESRPFSCGLAYENRNFPIELRHLLFEVWKGKPYQALFCVRDDVVKIVCIRAPGEKPVTPKDTPL
jgi:plasmid stabilization system protein ParE